MAVGSQLPDRDSTSRQSVDVVIGRLQRTLSRAAMLLGLIGVALIVVIFAVAIADITRRNLLDGRAIQFAVGLQEILLAAVAFALLPWAQDRREHVSVGLVVNRLPRRIRRGVELGTAVCLAAVMAWLTYISLDQALAAHAAGEVKPGVVALPIWPVRYLLVVAWGMLTMQFALTAVATWRQLRRPTAPANAADDTAAATHSAHASEDRSWSS